MYHQAVQSNATPIGFLAARIARTNNLGLFIWLCALVLPAALQLFSGLYEDVRSWLDAYFGVITLYFFFTMTFGFATVFATYYLLGGLRRSGSLESLKLSGLQPAEVVNGVLFGMLRMLLPPMLVFFAGLYVYSRFEPRQSFMAAADWTQLASFALVQLANVAFLVLFLCLFMYRGSEFVSGMVALAAGLLAVALNIAPIIAIVVFNVPGWAYLLLLAGAILLLRLLAGRRLSALWRPRQGAV